MKITIDTKEDSAEEIKKIVNFLSAFVGDRPIVSNKNIFDDNKPSDSNGNAFLSMFGSEPSTPAAVSQETVKKDESSSTDFPRIIEYM
jgi:hypothetical protein